MLPPLGFLPHCLSIGLYVFLLPQLLLESIASNDLLGPVCIVHRREGAAIPRQVASGHMHSSDPLGADRLDTLTLEPRKACGPVNRGPVILPPLPAEFWGDHAQKNHTESTRCLTKKILLSHACLCLWASVFPLLLTWKVDRMDIGVRQTLVQLRALSLSDCVNLVIY